MSKGKWSLLLSIVMLFSVSTFAVDGVVLINQASVMAAGGFPYKITQSGSYRLSGNLTITVIGTDAIDINADNVTLDLNGFTISGTCMGSATTGPCTGGEGVRSAGHNTTVKNGSVVGMGDGVDLNSPGGLVEEVHTELNGNSGMIVQGGTVRRSSAINNANEGIRINVGVVEANFASGNLSSGIDAFASTVTGNTSTNNGGYGLSVNRTVYGGNSIQFNGTAGVQSFGLSTSQNNNNCDGNVC